MTELFERITVDPEQCAGRPCIRGMRIRVSDVLDLLAAGLSTAEVLQELPDLERNDIHAALRFASRSERLQELLDRQECGDEMTPEQRREAEDLVALSELLSLLRLRAQRG